MICTWDHRELIEALLRTYNLDPQIVETVDDVAARSTELGYPDDNPFRTARSICTPEGTAYILISAEISDDMIESAKAAMAWRGFDDEVQRLSTDELFLEHLVLHEIACHVLGTGDQGPRDRWAFEHVSRTRSS